MHAWLTPETATGDLVCRRFSIPAEMLGAVTGALQELSFEHNWEAFGAVTPAEAAALMLEMLDTYNTDEGECFEMIGMLAYFFGDGPGSSWVLADGATYNRVDYPKFYAKQAAVGSTLIIDADTFVVPNAMFVFMYGVDDIQNEGGGEASHVLTIGEMPAHTHTVVDPGVLNAQAGVGAVPLSDPGLPTATGSTGGGAAHNNLPPYLTAFPYIKVR